MGLRASWFIMVSGDVACSRRKTNRRKRVDFWGTLTFWNSLGLQIAQSRYCLWTLGPNVGIIYRHGAPGIVMVGSRSSASLDLELLADSISRELLLLYS